MITFSKDPQLAEEQMRAIILYMAALGYVDESFDESEKAFVRATIRRLVEHRVRSAGGTPTLQAELVEKYTTHFLEVFQETDTALQALFTEAVAQGEDVNKFVYSRVKLRCYESFQKFDEDSRGHLLRAVDDFIIADGVVHPNEAAFRNELVALLAAEIPLEEAEIEVVEPAHVKVAPGTYPAPRLEDHPFLAQLEKHYSRDPELIRTQAAADVDLFRRTMAQLERARAASRASRPSPTSRGRRPSSTGTCTTSPPIPHASWSSSCSETSTAATAASRPPSCRRTSSARCRRSGTIRRRTPT